MKQQKSLNTFYILAATQTLSMLGSAMTSFALSIWIFTETGNITPLMIVGVMIMLPRMFLGSLGGVIADRLNRKNLIVFSDAMQALPTFLLMLAFLSHNFALWMLYVAAFVQGLFMMIQGPAIYASVTMLVPDSHRDRANAILEILGPAAGLAAPVIGGLLYAVIGVTGVLAIDVISFLIAVSVIARVHIPQPKQSVESAKSQGSFWEEIRGGFRFLWHRKPLLLLSSYFLLVNFLTNGIWQLMTPYALARLDYNEALVGIVAAFSSLGLLLGGLIPIFWSGTEKRIHTAMIVMTLGCVGLMVYGLAQSFTMLIIIVFFMMLPYKWTNALVSSIQQSKIPPDMQGRIIGLISQIATFAIPITMLITGPLVDQVLIPYANQPTWENLAPYFGTGEAGGIALYIFVCGFVLFIVSLVFYATPMLRHIEESLVNYVPEEEINSQQESNPQTLEPVVAQSK